MITEAVDVFISLIVALVSQYKCLSSHHAVHLKYIQFLFVNYTSVNLRRKKKKKNNQSQVAV